MDQLDFSAFTGGFWQDFHTALILFERTGVDVRILRQQVAEYNRQERLSEKRSRKKKPKAPKQSRARISAPQDAQTHMKCPLCNNSYLRQRKVIDPITDEPFADIYCSSCRASAEFK